MCAGRALLGWGVPQSVCDVYEGLGVSELYEWQVECLQTTKALARRNLVYSAPTSAGKTLVAEVLMTRTLMLKARRVIFVVPFVSIVMEKADYFRQLYEQERVRVIAYCTGANNPMVMDQNVAGPELSVCTIEKAHGVVNRLIREGRIHEVGCIVVDEAHMVGDAHRGALLEIMMAKVAYTGVGTQFVAMSATVPNLTQIAAWLKADLFVSDFRPIPLVEHVVLEKKVFDSTGALVRSLSHNARADVDAAGKDDDPDGIVALCRECIEQSSSVLVFCATKKNCENCAQSVTKGLRGFHVGREGAGLAGAREEIVKSLQGLQRDTIMLGIAYHHAGLTVDERGIIERAFHEGTISVLMATSTLAAGVNLPARRVVFRSPRIGLDLLDVTRYRQMCGRAGRAGKDLFGESFILTEKRDHKYVSSLVSQHMPPLESQLMQPATGNQQQDTAFAGLGRAVLEAIDNKIVETEEELRSFAACTLFSAQQGSLMIDEAVSKSLAALLQREMIVVQKDSNKYKCTLLGEAAVASSLCPREALLLFAELNKARQSLATDDDIHLIYLATPFSVQIEVSWKSYYDIFDKSCEPCKRIARSVGVSEGFLFNAKSAAPSKSRNEKTSVRIRVHERFFAALVLRELVQEKPLNYVASRFGLARGAVQQLQLETLCNQFQDRIRFGVRADIMPLMQVLTEACVPALQVPSMTGLLARSLAKRSHATLDNLAGADVSTIAEIIRQEAAFVQGSQGSSHRKQAEIIVRQARKIMGCDGTMGMDSGKTKCKYIQVSSSEEMCVLRGMLLRASSMSLALNEATWDFSQEKEIPAGLLGFALCASATEVHYFDLVKIDAQDRQVRMDFLRSVLCDKWRPVGSTITIFDAKKSLAILRSLGVDASIAVHDPLVAWFLLQTKHSVKVSTPVMLAQRYGCFGWDLLSYAGEGSSSTQRSCKEAGLALAVMGTLRTELESESLWTYYMDVEVPTLRVLAGMEEKGIAVDVEYIKDVEQRIRDRMSQIEKILSNAANRPVNLKSAAAIAGLLYEDLKLPLPPFAPNTTGGKARNASKLVSSDVLKSYSREHFAAALVLQYRKLFKALSSSLLPLKVNATLAQGASQHRVHPCQEQTMSPTGRITCCDPNFQCLPHEIVVQSVNVPAWAGGESLEGMAVSVRQCVIASEGFLLLSVDFSQIELRIVAHMSRDERLIEALDSGSDVFKNMASSWLRVLRANVSSVQRERAKRICYGLLYGMGAAALAAELAVDMEEAKELIHTFRQTYSGVDSFLNSIKETCREQGYVTTLRGRKRWFPDITSNDAAKKSQAQRQAVNTVVQGSAADILRTAMAMLHKELSSVDGKLVMQLTVPDTEHTEEPASLAVVEELSKVHDELVIEVKLDRVHAVANLVASCMERASPLSVPTNVKVRRGTQWGALTTLSGFTPPQ